MALSTADLAKQLDTAPKTLRQFLRSRSSGVGSGARYEFTPNQVDALRVEFEAWSADKATRRTRRTSELGDAPGLDLRTATPDDIQALTDARVNRLELALKASGLHISQMRDRDTWRPLVTADA